MAKAIIEKYKGESLATKEKIMNGVRPYINKVYKNAQYNIYWYINSHNYIHVLKPLGVKMDEKILHYTIEDFLLTKDNMLISKKWDGEFKSMDDAFQELERKVT